MRYLKKAAVIVCLLAIIVSTNGITLQSHMCSMAGKTTQTLFPEVFGGTNSCCCSLNPMAYGPSERGGTNISPVPCCKSTFKYSKVVYYNDTRVDICSPLRVLVSIADFMLIQTLFTEDSASNFITQYRPPPLRFYGRALLRFIHQIRIDLPF
jgi:hypothetical protein